MEATGVTMVTDLNMMSDWTTDLMSNTTMMPDDDGDNKDMLKLTTKVINILILTFLMVSMGCTIDLKDFKETVRHPAGFFVGMLCQFVLMPVIAFTLGVAFSLGPAGGLSLLILACCPGGTLSNLFTFWTHGDVCLSVCMTSVSTAIAIGMMPLNLFIYSRRWTDEKAIIPYVTIITTLISILIPVGFGVFLRWWKKEWMRTFTRIGIVLSFICILSAWILVFLLNPGFLLAPWQLWICAASLPMLGYTLGYGIALLLRQPHPKCRTVAFETGSQNVSLAMTLTVLTFSESEFFYDMLFYPTLYAVFIYIDSFVVIGIFKVAVYISRRKSRMMTLEEGDAEDDTDDEKEMNEVGEESGEEIRKVKLEEGDTLI